MTDRDYQHSKPLDVHCWSEHTEANKFVGYVYDTYLNNQSNENKGIKKRHLKVVLLDLYVAWLNDPDLNIAVHMTTGAYSDGTVFNKGKSRYNELNIKVSTIEIIHRLHEADLIGFQKGFEGSPEWQGYISRIWPSNKLTRLFEDAAFGEFDIGYTDNRETIILRDENKDEVEYTDKTHIKQMRLAVQQYNKLLEKTFIDIQSVDKPARIELPEGKRRRRSNRRVFVNITHHDKFVRRIFNNKSFSDGGRFYGGWWQRIDTKFRKDIRTNNLPTVEIDYSALHVILAYSEAGIDYWQTTNKDPYDLLVRGVNNPEHCRDITRLFLLLSLNASDKQALYKAFRSELNYREYPYSFPDNVLSELLDTIKENHPDISHMICSGAGLRLMNIDSRICDYVIADFVRTDTPILTVHDSFIVPIGEENRLNQLMKEAFEDVTYKVGIKAKFNQNLTQTQLSVHGAQDRDWYLRMVNWIIKGSPTIGYQSRLERHRKHFGQ
ncbi:hypothetical protein N8860_09120 [Alphaproteobacteria bacterium]|nr:hypothetical protein [Alphaproteobacteria bacterium]